MNLNSGNMEIQKYKFDSLVNSRANLERKVSELQKENTKLRRQVDDLTYKNQTLRSEIRKKGQPEKKPIDLLTMCIRAMERYYPMINITWFTTKARHREICEARQVAIYLISRSTRYSTKKIGNMFGGRDHSTILHAKNAVRNLAETSYRFYRQLENMEMAFESEYLKQETPAQ